MVEMRHVRFKLSELILAATRAGHTDHMMAGSEALTFYWNWALRRRWQLSVAHCYPDPYQRRANAIERNDQCEMFAPDEHWDCVFIGEDTDGTPDLVAEHGLLDLSQEARLLYQELFRRGWTEGIEALHKDGKRLPMETIIERADHFPPDSPSAEAAADAIECELSSNGD